MRTNDPSPSSSPLLFSVAGAVSSSVSSSAAGLHPTLEHACTRHLDMRGDAACLVCSAPLCTACARDKDHQRCPDCRTSAGLAPSVVDNGWRISLLADALVQGFRAVPRRMGALSAIFLFALVPGAATALDHGSELKALDLTLAGLATASFAFLLGLFFQPLMAIPLLRRPGPGRLIGGALAAGTVVFGSIVVAAVAGMAGGDEDLTGFLTMIALVIGVPCALAIHGQVLMGRRPHLGGLASIFGLTFSHAVVASLGWMLGSIFLLPLIFALGVGLAGAPTVGVVVALATGTMASLLTLIGVGAFGAGSARYLADQAQRLGDRPV